MAQKGDVPARGAPVVTEMQVIPVAGHDSMLLNLSGAHGPFFTRNMVILEGQRRQHRRRRSARRRENPPDARGRRDRWSSASRSGPTSILSRCGGASPTATPAGAGCRRSTCARPSMWSPRWRRAARSARASTSACRWRRCSAKASSASGARCWAISSTSATARKTNLPYLERAERRRRLVPAAPRGGADARGDRAAGRSGACALRLQ